MKQIYGLDDYKHRFTDKELQVFYKGEATTLTLPYILNCSLKTIRWRVKLAFGHLHRDSMPPVNYGRDWRIKDV